MNKQFRGSILLVLATIIWGAAFVSQRVGMNYVGPFTFQAVRCFLAVIGLIPVIFISDALKKDGKNFFYLWKNKKLWKAGILCGIPLFLACNLQQLGIVETDAGKAGFLTAMYIVIVPIISLLRGKNVSKLLYFSVALAVMGLYFLSCVGVSQINSSDLLLIGCAFMFAIQITFVDMFANDVDPLRLNLIQALVCAVLSAIVMIATERPELNGIWECRNALMYAGFLSMGAAYGLQILGQRNIGTTTASLIMSLESVFATLFGCVLLSETMSISEISGCVFIFAAVILSQIPTSRRHT